MACSISPDELRQVLPGGGELALLDVREQGAPIAPSDGGKGDRIPLAAGMWHDFHEFGCHPGNVGSCRS